MKPLLILALGLACMLPSSAQTAEPPAAPAPQIAFFNHGFAGLDPETAAAIGSSPLLHELMDVQAQTFVADGGETWSARYVYGRRTYFEFFELKPGEPGGWTGLAISPDAQGGLASLGTRLESAGVSRIEARRRTRLLGDTQVDWYDMIEAANVTDNAARIWAMEYVPAYFDHPLLDKEPAEGLHDAISRERYLADTWRRRLAHDISAIEIAAPADDLAELVPWFEAAGFRITRTPAGAVVQDDEITLTLTVAGPRGPGLRRLEFALNDNVAVARRERIGHSLLTLGPGSVAVWTFD